MGARSKAGQCEFTGNLIGSQAFSLQRSILLFAALCFLPTLEIMPKFTRVFVFKEIRD